MDRERGREPGKGGGGRGKGKVGGVERNKSQEKFHKVLKNSAAFRIPVEWKRVTESEKKKKLTDEGTIQQLDSCSRNS